MSCNVDSDQKKRSYVINTSTETEITEEQSYVSLSNVRVVNCSDGIGKRDVQT